MYIYCILAAHCFRVRTAPVTSPYLDTLPDALKAYTEAEEDLFVLVGGHHLPHNNKVPSFAHIENNINFRRVRELISHEKYHQYREGPQYNPYDVAPYDIALLKLESSLTFSATIGPVCLSATPATTHAGRVGMVSGWGTTNIAGTEVAMLLKHLKVNVLSNQQCIDKVEDWRVVQRQQPWARGDNLTQINEARRHITLDRYYYET